MTALLSVRDLRVAYRGTTAVSDYSVDLEPGTLTMLLGRNGAGKTSTLRGIVGFLPGETGHSAGRVELAGRRVRRPNPLALSRAGVDLIAERNKVFTGMTVDEQLRVVSTDQGDKAQVLEFFPRLQERLSVRAGLLSGGERQMLAFALALLRRPRVLLVDELSLGLAPGVVRELMQYLRRLVDDQGLAILAADQAVTQSLAVADRVQVMDHGRVVASGAIDDLDVDSILDTYLGREQV